MNHEHDTEGLTKVIGWLLLAVITLALISIFTSCQPVTTPDCGDRLRIVSTERDRLKGENAELRHMLEQLQSAVIEDGPNPKPQTPTTPHEH